MNEQCCCPDSCTERCRPGRTCTDADCLCFRMWSLEMDALTEATRHLSAEEIHQMAIDAWRES